MNLSFFTKLIVSTRYVHNEEQMSLINTVHWQLKQLELNLEKQTNAFITYQK